MSSNLPARRAAIAVMSPCGTKRHAALPHILGRKQGTADMNGAAALMEPDARDPGFVKTHR